MLSYGRTTSLLPCLLKKIEVHMPTDQVIMLPCHCIHIILEKGSLNPPRVYARRNTSFELTFQFWACTVLSDPFYLQITLKNNSYNVLDKTCILVCILQIELSRYTLR